eukprot:Rmarinus@m.21322
MFNIDFSAIPDKRFTFGSLLENESTLNLLAIVCIPLLDKESLQEMIESIFEALVLSSSDIPGRHLFLTRKLEMVPIMDQPRMNVEYIFLGWELCMEAFETHILDSMLLYGRNDTFRFSNRHPLPLGCVSSQTLYRKLLQLVDQALLLSKDRRVLSFFRHVLDTMVGIVCDEAKLTTMEASCVRARLLQLHPTSQWPAVEVLLQTPGDQEVLSLVGVLENSPPELWWLPGSVATLANWLDFLTMRAFAPNKGVTCFEGTCEFTASNGTCATSFHKRRSACREALALLVCHKTGLDARRTLDCLFRHFDEARVAAASNFDNALNIFSSFVRTSLPRIGAMWFGPQILFSALYWIDPACAAILSKDTGCLKEDKYKNMSFMNPNYGEIINTHFGGMPRLFGPKDDHFWRPFCETLIDFLEMRFRWFVLSHGVTNFPLSLSPLHSFLRGDGRSARKRKRRVLRGECDPGDYNVLPGLGALDWFSLSLLSDSLSNAPCKDTCYLPPDQPVQLMPHAIPYSLRGRTARVLEACDVVISALYTRLPAPDTDAARAKLEEWRRCAQGGTSTRAEP